MNGLMIAGSTPERLALWRRGLVDSDGAAVLFDNLACVLDDVAQIKPEVLLLDYELVGLNEFSSLRNICTQTKTIVIGNAISEEVEWELLKAGIRGCCRNDVEPKFLNQVVTAVQDGELWIRRTLTCRLIDELGKTTAKNRIYQASVGLLNKLTQREYDIAVRVGNGESNKQIAKFCAISERTVKAHLTVVFQKLGVSDRLNLALVLSADDRNNDFENAGNKINKQSDLNKSQISSQSFP